MHARYNPPQRMIFSPRFVVAAALLLCLLPVPLPAQARATVWDQPAADLAHQIAALTGPGPAKVLVRNNSTLSTAEIPTIRQLLERDLRNAGVLPTVADSATVIRITLSQNLQGGLWVAEVQEGTETRVVMLSVATEEPAAPPTASTLTLRRTLLATEPDPVLDASIIAQRLVVLEPERILVYPAAGAPRSAAGPAGVTESQIFPIDHARSFPRDLRGRIVPAQDHPFDAYLPGVLCTGTGVQLAVSCSESDDPWPITSSQRAFYNAMRDNFTGVLAPGYGMDLPAFYSAVEIPRATGSATLLNPVAGNVLLIENATAKQVTGTSDWGSDFAVIHSGCGSGAQVLVSGAGAAAAGDSLRAFEVSGREAIPVSAPLPIEGAITAISAAPDGTTVNVIVRRDAPLRYRAVDE